MDGDEDPSDANGHGTHVTGTIAADRGNGIGVAGIADDAAKVLAIRVLDGSGSGAVSNVTMLFVAAAGNGGADGVGDDNVAVGRALTVPLRVRLVPGTSTRVRLRLTRRGRAVLRRSDAGRLTLLARATDAAGNRRSLKLGIRVSR